MAGALGLAHLTGPRAFARLLARPRPPARRGRSAHRGPALKKAKAEGKIAGASIATRGVGAQANEVTTSEFYNKFADLDAPNAVASVVGPEANAKINAKSNALATSVQTIIRRRIADLGF